MSIEYVPTSYSPTNIKTGIVHLGLGAFVRAHLAVYNQILFNRSSTNEWGICAVNIRSNADIVEILQQQNLSYTVAEYQNSEQVCLRQVSSIREVMFAGDTENRAALLKRLQDTEIKIVSLTITEKGYYLNPADGKLLIDDTNIQHDLNNPTAPKTALGILAAALKFRMTHNLMPFTVLCCDNLPHNGESLRSALIQFSNINDPELSEWIAKTVLFPSTMVDRIVPAVTAESLQKVNALLQQNNSTFAHDNAAIATEQFSQWVIEDTFSQDRPDWNLAGAQFVDDVAPFETMKLRMLNGSHSLLAYLGNLGKYEYVSDCMQDANYVKLITHYMLQEAAPTLAMPPDTNLQEYAESLLNRFRNDSLKHRTAQIAMDGSNKIPQRWLSGASLLLERNRTSSRDQTPNIVALGIAAWIRYTSGIDEQGKSFTVDDPLANTFKVIHSQNLDPEAVVNAFLRTRVFINNFDGFPKFIEKIVAYYRQLLKLGAKQTVHHLVADLKIQ